MVMGDDEHEGGNEIRERLSKNNEDDKRKTVKLGYGVKWEKGRNGMKTKHPFSPALILTSILSLPQIVTQISFTSLNWEESHRNRAVRPSGFLAFSLPSRFAKSTRVQGSTCRATGDVYVCCNTVGIGLDYWGFENGAWNRVFWVEWDEEEDGEISGCWIESGSLVGSGDVCTRNVRFAPSPLIETRIIARPECRRKRKLAPHPRYN
ncbi:hypothetical protein DFP72DRAFT_848888 [Ephemerocybe angulata]|uniref:Uncharacterized protein n=1 Tax=Ephemerocybe angulata TaxID=980116 RepID=A0A8H6HWG2_9AGAR|nr:hypothetical protein DFP72DRAFT_848888 [Tulosesus angulatus]